VFAVLIAETSELTAPPAANGKIPAGAVPVHSAMAADDAEASIAMANPVRSDPRSTFEPVNDPLEIVFMEKPQCQAAVAEIPELIFMSGHFPAARQQAGCPSAKPDYSRRCAIKATFGRPIRYRVRRNLDQIKKRSRGGGLNLPQPSDVECSERQRITRAAHRWSRGGEESETRTKAMALHAEGK
jgi:hypothetical protein